MDGTSIFIAGVMFAVLIAWYILLEYDERQQRQDADRQKTLAAPDARAEQRHNAHDGR